jgi:hypothetical protein
MFLVQTTPSKQHCHKKGKVVAFWNPILIETWSDIFSGLQHKYNEWKR